MDALRLALSEYTELEMHSFHTPGHKGRKDLFSALAFPDYDLTELPGLDMLHNPQGIIAQAQKRAAEAYGSEETFFLVNGATSGNQAMFLALMSGVRGEKVRIERQAHRSVISALILSGLVPEYIAPVIHPDFNLPLGLNTAEYLGRAGQVAAFHLTNPRYYGSAIDLEAVIRHRDENLPHLPVLVDQAHGSHFKGPLFPKGAVAQGADLVVHSTHKTLTALTQAGMLHVQGERVERSALKKALELLQTSSPSYLLLASLEAAVRCLAQEQLWQDLYEEVLLLQQRLNGPLRILTAADAGSYGIQGVDWSKILVNVSTLGIGAPEAVEVLRSSFRIEPELWDDENILFLLGIGNRPEEVRILRQALESLVKRYKTKHWVSRHAGKGKNRLLQAEAGKINALPPMRLTPRQAWLAPKRSIKVKDALGEIAGETVSIYPPGIPLIAAGEEITPFVFDYLQRAKEYNWQGWQGFQQGEIQVVDD